jgi:hypothetical protein
MVLGPAPRKPFGYGAGGVSRLPRYCGSFTGLNEPRRYIQYSKRSCVGVQLSAHGHPARSSMGFYDPAGDAGTFSWPLIEGEIGGSME